MADGSALMQKGGSMRTVASVTLVIFLVSCTLFAAEGQKLSYRTSPDMKRGDVQVYWMSQPAPAEPKDMPLPKNGGFDPVYAKWQTPMVKEGSVWMAAARSKKGGAYDLLYVDSNCDGRMVDETAAKPVRTEGNYPVFGPIAIRFPGDNEPITYDVDVMLTSVSVTTLFSGGGAVAQQPRFEVTSGCWHEGEIEVGGKTVGCKLVDVNANGAFDDTSLAIYGGDYVFIKEADKPWDYFSVGKYVCVGGKLCNEEVARDGSWVKITEAGAVPSGTVKIPDTLSRFEVIGTNGDVYFLSPGSHVSVPVGTWRIGIWCIERTDAKGTKWRMSGGFFPDKANLTLVEGQEITLPIGEPVKAVLSASQSGGQYTITESITGGSGESIAFAQDDKALDLPSLRIRNADGSYDKVFKPEAG